ncbi:MAG TPA: ACT domain-containing protein [Gaiellaceae bacterium]
MSGLDLRLLAGSYAVSRLSPDEALPEWARGELLAVIWTPDELSIVSAADSVPESVRSELGWRVLRVAGPLDFSLVGILAALTGALARAEVAVFSLSTFDTDYLLVRERDLERALSALESDGHRIATSEA